jgi:hypothetical protein
MERIEITYKEGGTGVDRNLTCIENHAHGVAAIATGNPSIWSCLKGRAPEGRTKQSLLSERLQQRSAPTQIALLIKMTIH